MVRALLFDLDNTLYDNEQLTIISYKQAVSAMIEKGLSCSQEEGEKMLWEITKKDPQADRFLVLTKECGNEDTTLAEIGKKVYSEGTSFDSLKLFPNTIETLRILSEKHDLYMITSGSIQQQSKKIDILGIRKFFKKIYIDGVYGDKTSKGTFFDQALQENNLAPEDVLAVGDRIDKELAIAKKKGMKTARILFGKYKSLTPDSNKPEEIPDYEITDIMELIDIVE